MSKKKSEPNTTLLPLEILLIGAWISLTVFLWVARVNHHELTRAGMARQLQPLLAPVAEQDRFVALRYCATELDRDLAFRAGVAETLLGAFLVLLALRRQARGLSLLLPFTVLAGALVQFLLFTPEMARLGKSLDFAVDPASPTRARGFELFHDSAAGLDLLEVVLLFTMFVLIYRESLEKR